MNDQSLEEAKLVSKRTFDEFEIFRGKRIQEDKAFNFLQMKKMKESSYKMVGLVKGWIEIFNHDDDDQGFLKQQEAKKLQLEKQLLDEKMLLFSDDQHHLQVLKAQKAKLEKQKKSI